VIGYLLWLVRLAPWGLGALSGGLILLQWPFVGLLAMVALIPIQEVTVFLSKHTLVWILGVVVLGAWILRVLYRKEQIRLAARPTAIAILWLFWGVLSFFWAEDQAVALSRAIILAQLIAFFVLFQALVQSDRRFRILLSAYFAVSVLASLFVINTGLFEGFKRASLTEKVNPNHAGQVLAIALLFTPYMFRHLRKIPWKVLTILGAASLVIAILMTGARGAWVGLVAAVGFTWLVTRGKAIRVRSLVTVGVLLIAGIVLLNFYGVITDYVIQRILTLPDLGATRGGAGRTNIWRVGWEMIKAHPIIGVGLQNFPARFEDYIKPAGLVGVYAIYPGRDPHSIFLAIQGELGIIGLIIFGGFLWSIFKRLCFYRFDQRGALGLLILIFLVVFGLSGTLLYQKPFWLGLSLATVMPMVVQNERD